MEDSLEQKLTYLHENVEVVKTGRTATKELRKSTAILYEITPSIPTQGSWTKWVREVDLYIIMEDDNE